MKRVRLLSLASVLALAACGSLFESKAPPPSVYLLSFKANAPSSAEIPVDLAVLKPRVRIGLGNDYIAVLYPDRRLDHFAGARWSGPLDEVVQDLALQAFRARANFRTVRTDASAFGSGYWLEIDVVDFQAEYASGGGPPNVHVHLLGRLGRSGDRHLLGQFDADERQPATDDRLRAIVEAYNQAADTALAAIVGATTEAVNGNLERR